MAAAPAASARQCVGSVNEPGSAIAGPALSVPTPRTFPPEPRPPSSPVARAVRRVVESAFERLRCGYRVRPSGRAVDRTSRLASAGFPPAHRREATRDRAAHASAGLSRRPSASLDWRAGACGSGGVPGPSPASQSPQPSRAELAAYRRGAVERIAGRPWNSSQPSQGRDQEGAGNIVEYRRRRWEPLIPIDAGRFSLRLSVISTVRVVPSTKLDAHGRR